MENVVLFAYRNKKNRFFVTTKDSTFEDVVVENLFIDSCCRSHLLPLAPKQLDDVLVARFKDTCVWKITESGNASGNKQLVLTLAYRNLKSMVVRFTIQKASETESAKYSEFQLRHLRFQLNRNDTQRLLELHNQNIIQLSGRIPKVELTSVSETRRKHGLIGLDFAVNKFVVTMDRVLIHLDTTKGIEWNSIPKVLENVENRAQEYVHDFGRREFNDLDDYDHGDGDYTGAPILDLDDLVDEDPGNDDDYTGVAILDSDHLVDE